VEDSCPRLNNVLAFCGMVPKGFGQKELLAQYLFTTIGFMEAVFRKYGFGCYLFFAYTDGFRNFFVTFTLMDWIG
ncbi:uncharacterized protein METZ01_LOCUS411703, partial [marine metagenome]